ncbi:hypothetical protein BC343_10505 [Mucilaginibacter pedocola]|uniref:Glycosyltransferase 2-like domain-containing protein n=2 Tax=Mucilaginibacter pedocola TaxID=1792845 RepID=A0A1S9PBR8_9SPHI|nr:hypothetical protein BC343_10505 [Mucilaginibacter pedocola]
MPAYNAEKYITEAVQSVLGQTYPYIQLIVVNDGSADGTAEQLAKITDSRLTVIHQENKGQCAAANAAYKAATGHLIKFMDADDMISPTFIQKQVERLGNRTDAVASAAWGRFYNDDLATFKLNPEEVWQDMPPDEWLAMAWGSGASMMQCALWLIPRPILERSGLWDESLSLINDFDFFARVLLAGKQVLFERDAILYYRSGISGSLSDTKSAESLKSAFRSIEKGTGSLLAVNNSKRMQQACANVWQSYIYNFYPAVPQLIKRAEANVKLLGGANLKYHAGGLTKLLMPVVGWKLMAGIKQAYNRLRYATSNRVTNS